jgi:hypothetical protein
MAWVIGIGITLFLLFKFPKPMLGIVGVFIIIAVGTAGYLWLNEKQESALRNAITIDVVHDPSRCSPEYPLFITISNRSARTLKRLNFYVTGFREGYSDPVFETASTWDTDKIISPNQTFQQCWSSPPKSYGVSDIIAQSNPPEKLQWVGKVAYLSWAE